MTNTNDCQNRHETIAALVLGELEVQAADEIKKHIDTCEQCRLLYQALTEEEETVQSAFKAIDDRSKEVGASLIAQLDRSSRKSYSEPTILHKLRVSRTPKRMAELAAAAVIVIGAFIGIYQFGGSTVAWADVAERFRSVPFFSASIYIKDDVLAEPRQFELWMGQQGRARVRVGSQVIFSRAGEIIKAFDLKKRREAEPDRQAVELLRMLGTIEEYSLETVIRSISGGKLIDVTPLVNADAVISEDMVVFDALSESSPEWLRVSALRESRLPVGIRMWDPRDGACVDVFITYSRQQPELFFDAQAFSTKLTDRDNTWTNLAYMFLKDPGGQVFTPKDLLERESGSGLSGVKGN
ncbi:MAG: hypothetical protein CEE38_13570 [Planctomycetes bacterium B3_Pla]|nr:MAG: hypothetical protein CEE38_13570 [Planctomycetes bacterium B3_Pla]